MIAIYYLYILCFMLSLWIYKGNWSRDQNVFSVVQTGTDVDNVNKYDKTTECVHRRHELNGIFSLRSKLGCSLWKKINSHVFVSAMKRSFILFGNLLSTYYFGYSHFVINYHNFKILYDIFVKPTVNIFILIRCIDQSR